MNGRKKRIGFVFPAFAMRYRDFHGAEVPGYEDHCDRLIALASNVVDFDRRRFNREEGAVPAGRLERDLLEHYICYVSSCAIADILRERNIGADYAAAYSMGVFACLYHTRAVSFEDGLRLMTHTCKAAHSSIRNGDYGMGVVAGLTPAELSGLIARGAELAIADVCGECVVIVSGKAGDIANLLASAREAGAIQASPLPISLPYHSRFMKQAEEGLWKFLPQIQIRSPECPIVSCVNQELLTSARDIEAEVTGNVGHAIHWSRTVEKLLGQGVNVVVECGASGSLCKLIGKFGGGSDIECYHPKRFHELFLESAPPSRRAATDKAAVERVKERTVYS